ncbi:response regulator [Qipengyuania sp. JC766]|uniref:response regulator n=1 Tax=Qipengyuania sp. JC766 TaxID=3232139 RepID=UPI0034578FFB
MPEPANEQADAPAPRVQPEAAPPSEAAEPKPLGRNPVAPGARRALIVDDSRMVRRISRGLLEGCGYTVTEAENGTEAIARVRADGMPQLVMLDWNMPEMNGLETLKALRENAGDAMPRVLFCTTNSDSLDIHKGIEAGAQEWMVKPFDKAALEAKLERIGAI